MAFPTFVVVERPKGRPLGSCDHHPSFAGTCYSGDRPASGDGGHHAPVASASGLTIAVSVFATERLTGDWSSTWLDAHPRISLLPTEQAAKAGVLLYLAPRSEEQAVRLVRRLAASPELRKVPKVLVAPCISGAALLNAFEHGVVSFLDHGATCLTRVTEALIEADRGGSRIPGPLMRALADQVREQRQDLAAATRSSGLEPREIEVLRLLAEGCDVREIAARLRFSESTVKGVIHGVVKRLGLRNRIEAVAYGIKVGAF